MKFTTHYAVCVIDSNVWDDSSLKLKDKFAQGRFWDHPGESNFLAPSQSSVIGSKRANPPVKNDGVPWEYDCIETIDSGQVIGQTNMSDREISAVYRELRQDWQYMPVFWNCHDLAIRLTHLVITPSKDAVTFLRNLMYSLVRAYNKEVGWFEIRCWFGLGGWCTAVAGGIACFPPMSAVGGAVFMAGWATGFVGTFVNDAKVKKKFAYMRKLEERFPVLKSLHPDSE
ncbi:uncharacterized protein BDV14DRAFT_32080 [Aspergillus stella-maris]|uniref:uncharacterized protein n=1 Tax=Aspergillus stella-maris TaxID=1810926 RepID=UPI003CCCE359